MVRTPAARTRVVRKPSSTLTKMALGEGKWIRLDGDDFDQQEVERREAALAAAAQSAKPPKEKAA